MSERKVLVLTNGVNDNVYLSGRNLPRVMVLPFSDVSAYHLLWSDVVMIEAQALGQTLAPVADTEVAPSKKASSKKAAKPPKAEKKAAPEKKAVKAAAPKAKKAAKKPAAKKAAKAQSKPKKKKGK
jgi:hypothetical protein